MKERRAFYWPRRGEAAVGNIPDDGGRWDARGGDRMVENGKAQISGSNPELVGPPNNGRKPSGVSRMRSRPRRSLYRRHRLRPPSTTTKFAGDDRRPTRLGRRRTAHLASIWSRRAPTNID